jgi:uncharacterized membrane protein
MESKHWYESKTIWGTILALLASIVPLISKMGVDGLSDNAVQIAAGVAAVVGGAVAIYGRYKATKSIAGN